MKNEKPLSSVDSTYNNLKDIQRSSYLDSSSNPQTFDVFSNKKRNKI